MKNPDPDLPREPQSQLDFLFLVGFFKWFDLPFILGLFVGPVAIIVGWRADYPKLSQVVLVAILGYVMWLCILIFRTMHFVIKNIGATKNLGYDAARIAASYLTGSK